MPLARYLYPGDRLVSWLEEHLSHQRENGALYDWIASGRSEAFVHDAPRCQQVYRVGRIVLTADKNTTASDQESSAVHSARQYVDITGDVAWLDKRLHGRSVLERLDAALGFLFRERFDERLGLVTSGFTADWGDVSPVYPDQRAIYLDDATPLVAGIYANALAFRAARELAELLEARGAAGEAARWSNRAEALKASIQRRLWDERRGFFRIHVHSSGPRLSFDDSDIFALGGNTHAVLAGVATPEQSARIFAVAEERRAALGVPTIAGVLLPPYPTGFFRHPILTEAWTYQNGGQWDWWAGPFLIAEFREGHARTARTHLAQILERVEATGGLFEWSTREGEGRGSPEYAGSAASLGAAIVEGLFGVSLRADRLDIRARGCADSASIDLTEPETGSRVLYRCEEKPAEVALGFETDGVAPGRLCVLLPEGGEAVALELDGAGVPFTIETVAHDAYACVDTTWGRQQLSVRLRG